MFAAESTPLPCGPPAIQFSSSFTNHFTDRIILNKRLVLSACCLIGAYAAVAASRFAAVWAYAFAVIYGVTASFACGFFHCLTSLSSFWFSLQLKIYASVEEGIKKWVLGIFVFTLSLQALL
jgi:hypothetical protein